MILIKDRHFSPLYKFTYALFGKYDTYKGSTLIDLCCSLDNWDWGNMILIKDRQGIFPAQKFNPIFGKYDIDKG